MGPVLPTEIVPSIVPAEISPRRVAREFRRLLDSGAAFLPVGEAKQDPNDLLYGGYLPKYKLELFNTWFYLTNVRQNPALRFFVVYVTQSHPRTGRVQIHPRIFYKDLSLVWRCASHMIANDDDFWIGKGDVRDVVENGKTFTDSIECTTDLPCEMQAALETLNRAGGKVRFDEEALWLVLQNGPNGRIWPYNDFSGPRERAMSNPKNLINRNQSIARFTRKNDPTSLKIVAGFEPDFTGGIIDVTHLRSAMYGGALRRYRILSRNKKIQYTFLSGQNHVWIIPPQTLTTELSSFGVRTVDVIADDDLFVPGYEYHFFDDDADEGEHFSQIPPGFAGALSEHDSDRADASAWLDKIPIIAEFRRKVDEG